MGSLIISFSGRKNGNCDEIGQYIASTAPGENRFVRFGELNVHPCSGCEYECFGGACRYREDDIYSLWEETGGYDRVILIVPMYCGNPASLYFVFNERSQDYFSHNESDYEDVVRRLYIIGVYGKAETSPDFVPCLEQWFEGSGYTGRVLGIERHLYGQKLGDRVLDVAEVAEKIGEFLKEGWGCKMSGEIWLAAFKRLEASRKLCSEPVEYDKEGEAAMNAKYGSVD